ncbi:MAG: hypothetical protein GX256_09650 [Fretibacterium sp.]|nr:hypothetical protein [Fretibacterium sp.]
MGSHVDVVCEVGMSFDGVLGVLSRLEAVRALNEVGVSTRCPVAVLSPTKRGPFQCRQFGRQPVDGEGHSTG